MRASFIRMGPLTKPRDLVRLLCDHWGVEPPKLIVSIHGGMSNFELPPKLKLAFRKSLQKMAAIPGCWILTNGLNVGIAKHVGDCITTGFLRRNRAVVIGICPWGIISGRNRLHVRNGNVSYFAPANSYGSTVLNPNHSFYILIDNGTVGHYGHDMRWRQEFESELSNDPKMVPLVPVLVEGGSHCIRLAADYLTNCKPLVVVAESGRAADLLKTALNVLDNQKHPVHDTDYAILQAKIEQIFPVKRSKIILSELNLCSKMRNFITIWNGDIDLDVCVFTAFLNAKRPPAAEQLRLALAWNRVDLARTLIFSDKPEWQIDESSIHELFFEALTMDRVEFVKLMLERGFDVQQVLTWKKLEQLYNINHLDAKVFLDVAKWLTGKTSLKHITLKDVGTVLEQLIGFGYISGYRKTKLVYGNRKLSNKIKNALKLSMKAMNTDGVASSGGEEVAKLSTIFRYPFSELVIWAVLLRRQKLALLLCSQGEEMLAKSLIASKLYRSLAEQIEDDANSELIEVLKHNGKEFSKLAVELLDHCRRLDEVMSQQLLTYELSNFSNKTCLSLAAYGENKHLVAHVCCQNLLDMLWMGGLRVRSTRPWKILLGILCPPFAIYGLKYLTEEELNLQPQTEAEWEEIRSNQRGEHFTENNSDGTLTPDDMLASDTKASDMPTVSFPLRKVHSFGFGSMQNLEAAREMKTEISTHDVTVSLGPGPTKAPLTRKLSILGSGAPSALKPDIQLFGNYKAKQLNNRTKFKEFYNAPVTKFWLHTVNKIFF